MVLVGRHPHRSRVRENGIGGFPRGNLERTKERTTVENKNETHPMDNSIRSP